MNLKKDKNTRILTLITVTIIVLILFFTGYSLGKGFTNTKINTKTQIAKPILVVENNPSIDITALKNTGNYDFKIKNYNEKEEINQIMLKYYIEIISKYNETIEKLNEYKETEKSNEETEKVIDNELEQVNMLLGKTDVQGKGIEIFLRDTEDEEVPKINADDLLVIVNALKLAGAEAISINDQRIINMTDIVNVDTYIKVNGNRILSPYTIKAIGNQIYLESELIGNGGYVDTLRKSGHSIEIQKKDNVEILKYNGEIKTKYIE